MELGYAKVPFDYYGQTPGAEEQRLRPVIAPMIGDSFKSGLITVKVDEETSKLSVKVPPMRALAAKPKRFASGHGACPGAVFSRRWSSFQRD